MSGTLIAKRYAKALMKVSSSKDDAEKLAEELAGAVQLFNFEQSRKILMSPVMPQDLKRNLMDYGLKLSNGSERTRKFSNELIHAGRLHLFPQIFSEFKELLSINAGAVRAEVTTAVEIGDKEAEALKTALQKVFEKKVTIEKKIDKDLLGGTVVRVGNYLIDMSLKSKVRSLSQSFVVQ